MKVILKLLILIGITVYLFFAFTQWNKADASSICLRTEIVISDSDQVGFIRAADVEQLLKDKKLMPDGKLLSEVNVRDIEECLKKHPFIDSVICYEQPASTFKQSGAVVKVVLTQLHPVMRIMAENGEDYYIDADGKVLPRMNYTAYLPVATGHISKGYAKEYLTQLGAYLQQQQFWNDQVEQINVDEHGSMELVTRVGEQVILLGQPVNLEKKFDNLRRFYEKVLSQVGWNKYTKINLEFDNQVIGVKST